MGFAVYRGISRTECGYFNWMFNFASEVFLKKYTNKQKNGIFNFYGIF